MIKVNINEIKAQLSHYVERALQGEQIVICKHNRPVAEIKRLQADRPGGPRPFGLAEGRVEVPAAFFDPLPEEEIAAFYPGAGALPQRGAPRVAEAPSGDGRPRPRGAARTPKGRRRS